MVNKLIRLILDPYPLRTVAKKAIRKFRLGSYEHRVQLGAIDRPHYGYCIYNAAVLAVELGLDQMSALEFGVAGGKGLLNLEYHARQVEKLLPISIEVYGFDIGEGLPKPVDYRDLPYHFKEGFYKMDVDKLQKKLERAQLVLGDVKKTRKSFFQKYDPAPIGAVLHDLDLYSSTASALKMFDADQDYYLPRVFCYFDDTVGTEVELYNEYTGERLAIREFNRVHENKKLATPYHLTSRKVVEPWYHKIWIYHHFTHHLYNDFVAQDLQERIRAGLTLD